MHTDQPDHPGDVTLPLIYLLQATSADGSSSTYLPFTDRARFNDLVEELEFQNPGYEAERLLGLVRITPMPDPYDPTQLRPRGITTVLWSATAGEEGKEFHLLEQHLEILKLHPAGHGA